MAATLTASAIELTPGYYYGVLKKRTATMGYYQGTINAVYRLNTTGQPDFTIAFTPSSTYAMGEAGAFANGDLYTVNNYTGYRHYVNDAGEAAYDQVSLSFNNGVADMAFDETAQVMYAWCFNDSYSGDKGYLATMDLSTFAFTPIGGTPNIQNVFITGLAADKSGHIYAMGDNGQLYQVSTTDGSLTSIGDVNASIVGSHYRTNYMSMTWDPNINKLAYAFFNSSFSTGNEDYAIYTIDPATGVATRAVDIDEARLIALCAPLATDPSAPGAVTDFTATNNGIDNNITVSFTLPTTTHGGDALSGTVKYTITLDGEATDYTNVSDAAGTAVTKTIETTSGTHNVSVYCSNLNGDGQSTSASLYVGPDTPAAPGNVVLAAKDLALTLTWEAPMGTHGGVYDATKLAYNVYAMPAGTKVAENITETTWTATASEDGVNPYKYKVEAVYDGEAGLSTESNVVYAGVAFDVTFENPYFEDFEDCTTVEDAAFIITNKENTYGYDLKGSIEEKDGNKYLWGRQASSDDGSVFGPTIYAPAVKLREGHTYKLSFKWCAPNNYYTYGVGFGTKVSPTPSAEEGTTIDDPGNYKGSGYSTKEFSDDLFYEKEFTVEKDGVYFVGWYTPNYYNYSVCLDDFKIQDLTEPNILTPITDMTASIDPETPNNVNISFKLPASGSKGEANITKAELYRGETLINTWTEGLTDGAEISFTDENVPMGVYTYKAIAYNADSNVEASVEGQSGNDYDLTVTATVAPATVTLGHSANIEVTIKNIGLKADPAGIVARLFMAGEGILDETESTEPLASGEERTLTIVYTPTEDQVGQQTFQAIASLGYEDDANTADNWGTQFTIDVVLPEFPAVSGLSGSWADGANTLSWTAPEYDTTGTLTLTGYDIYRNDEKIATETGTTYSDNVGITEYEYYVIAVYNYGQSEPSEKVTVTPTPALPAVTNLQGTWAEGIATLTWTDPVYDTAIGLEFLGTTIYRDGERLADTEAGTNSYADPFTEGSHIYYVIANYNAGTSAPSESVTVEVKEDGINGVYGTQTGVSVSNGTVTICAPANTRYMIANASGAIVARGTTAANLTTISLERGVYVITVASNAYKVAL